MTEATHTEVTAERLHLQAEWESEHGGDLITINHLRRAAQVMQLIEHLHGVVYAARDFEIGARVTWTDGMGRKHAGIAVTYSDAPTYLLDLDDGRRLMVRADSVNGEKS